MDVINTPIVRKKVKINDFEHKQVITALTYKMAASLKGRNHLHVHKIKFSETD